MSEVIITVRDDGSYRIEGPVVLLDGEVNPCPIQPGEPLKLCRCGHSETKPFCDRTHRLVGFSSRVRAPRPAEELGDEPGDEGCAGA